MQCALVMNAGTVHALLRTPSWGASVAAAVAAAVNMPQGHGLQQGTDSRAEGAGLSWREVLRAAAKPAFVIGIAMWYPLTMGCAPFDRSAIGEIRALLLRDAAVANVEHA